MPAARRAKAAVLFAGSIFGRRDAVAAQQRAVFVVQFEDLLRQADADLHGGLDHATRVRPRRAAKNPDSRLPQSSASTPPVTEVW
jgi:hypothetical protein